MSVGGCTFNKSSARAPMQCSAPSFLRGSEEGSISVWWQNFMIWGRTCQEESTEITLGRNTSQCSSKFCSWVDVLSSSWSVLKCCSSPPSFCGQPYTRGSERRWLGGRGRHRDLRQRTKLAHVTNVIKQHGGHPSSTTKYCCWKVNHKVCSTNKSQFTFCKLFMCSNNLLYMTDTILTN